MDHEIEALEFDVLFVGGGPANLAGAIHLMDMAQKKGVDIEVCLIEKAESIGSHSLSGAVLDPRALKELIPDYIEKGCPIETSDLKEGFYYLTRKDRYRLPYIPRYLQNHGCHIISLSKFCTWLEEQAEALGINIFPGFCGVEALYAKDKQRIIGVRTGDKGCDKDGNPKSNFEPGVDLVAKVTVLGEGPKGSLMRQIDDELDIFVDKMPQVYETAIKEVIEIPVSSPFFSSKETVIHTFSYPLGLNTKGGGFLYKMKDNHIALGLVMGLDYENPWLEPYQEFLHYKRHPFIADMIRDGKVLQQGAKTLSTGGWYTMPKLAIDGALFVGDSASMLNIQRLKGIHTAMKSGMLAAETTITALEKQDYSAKTLSAYTQKVENSWIQKELYAARNFGPALSQKGIRKFFTLTAQYLSKGRGFKDPMEIVADSSSLKKRNGEASIAYNFQNPDGKLYVDKLTGVYLSGTQHEEDQPCHLFVHDTNKCVNQCYVDYGNPCTRFCPGQVYELRENLGTRRLVLNPSNCLHCKTCEIKDPFGNITWTCPEGGGGPRYSIM